MFCKIRSYVNVLLVHYSCFNSDMTFVLLFHLVSYVDCIAAITFIVKQWLVVPAGIISSLDVKCVWWRQRPIKMDSFNHCSSAWRVPENCVKLTVSMNHTSQIPFTAQYLHHNVCRKTGTIRRTVLHYTEYGSFMVNVYTPMNSYYRPLTFGFYVTGTIRLWLHVLACILLCYFMYCMLWVCYHNVVVWSC